MRSIDLRRTSFVLGFAAALGGVVAFAVVASAGGAGPEEQLPTREQASSATLAFPAFQRTRSAGDALTPAAAALLAPLTANAPRPELDPGALLVTESRRIAGPAGEVAFLVPTEKGQVCFAALVSNEAGCSDGTALAQDGIDLRLLDEDGLGHGSPTVLRGFTADTVASVAVVSADRRVETASIANGMFLATSNAVPENVVVSFDDGTQRRLSISPPKE